MKQRLLVRRRNDKGHVYCLVSKGNRDEVYKIGVNSNSQTDAKEQIHAVSIWDSPTSKLLALEPDPESSDRLFVLDAEKHIITLEDSEKNTVDKSAAQNNKANVLKTQDMARH